MADYLLLEQAEGLIEAGMGQQERLEEVTTRVASGEFHVLTDSTIISRCKDGRNGSTGLWPNSAGGTETLMVADDLTAKHFATDSTTAGAYGNMLDKLIDRGVKVGAHTDEFAEHPVSGCGANDQLSLIYGFIARHSELVRSLATAMGVTVQDATHDHIIAAVAARAHFSDGDELLKLIREKAGNEAVDTLRGQHHEVIATMNLRPGTTLDRDALEAAFGSNYQSFNVDVWAFEASARVLLEASNQIIDEQSVQSLVLAMTYYNLGTAHILCGKKMRVAILK